MNMERPEILLAVCILLQHSHPTIPSVEKNFSMLRKLFAKDRIFKVEIVKQDMILHLNSRT